MGHVPEQYSALHRVVVTGQGDEADSEKLSSALRGLSRSHQFKGQGCKTVDVLSEPGMCTLLYEDGAVAEHVADHFEGAKEVLRKDWRFKTVGIKPDWLIFTYLDPVIPADAAAPAPIQASPEPASDARLQKSRKEQREEQLRAEQDAAVVMDKMAAGMSAAEAIAAADAERAAAERAKAASEAASGGDGFSAAAAGVPSMPQSAVFGGGMGGLPSVPTPPMGAPAVGFSAAMAPGMGMPGMPAAVQTGMMMGGISMPGVQQPQVPTPPMASGGRGGVSVQIGGRGGGGSGRGAGTPAFLPPGVAGRGAYGGSAGVMAGGATAADSWNSRTQANKAVPPGNWTCNSCNARNGQQLQTCWKCHSGRDAPPNPEAASRAAVNQSGDYLGGAGRGAAPGQPGAGCYPKRFDHNMPTGPQVRTPPPSSFAGQALPQMADIPELQPESADPNAKRQRMG